MEVKITDLVQSDIRKRDEIGQQRYGKSLYASTPVDLLEYAYEEALDLAIYLRGEIDRRSAERSKKVYSVQADEWATAYGISKWNDANKPCGREGCTLDVTHAHAAITTREQPADKSGQLGSAQDNPWLTFRRTELGYCGVPRCTCGSGSTARRKGSEIPLRNWMDYDHE